MVYDRAPIIQAIVDIQVRFSDPPPLDLFNRLTADLKPDFPESVGTHQLTLNVNVNAAGPLSTTAEQSGFGQQLTSTKGDRILQITQTRMALTHLPPYTQWSEFRKHAATLWQKYCETVHPVGVTRIALRYINRIVTPIEKLEPRDYFDLYIQIPGKISQDMSAFFTQVQMPQRDLGPDVMAIINLATQGPQPDKKFAFLLDLDVFAVRDMPVDAYTVFSALDKLRDRKNELFEACITNKSRELFK